MVIKTESDSDKGLLPSARVLGKMGLITDQEGIMRRYLQEADNWTDHLEHTREFIEGALDSVEAGSVSILGSGWMLDIPVEYLLENYSRVCFYDIRHPHAILGKYNTYSQAHFIEMDLTGGLIRRIYDIRRKRSSAVLEAVINSVAATDIQLPESSDYYISVNLLNQLDILLIDFLKKRAKYDLSVLNTLRRAIQEAHLRMLPAGRSSLITDYQELYVDSHEEVQGKENLIYCSLPEGSYSEEWLWKFDSHKTYHPRWKTYFKVKAIRL